MDRKNLYYRTKTLSVYIWVIFVYSNNIQLLCGNQYVTEIPNLVRKLPVVKHQCSEKEITSKITEEARPKAEAAAISTAIIIAALAVPAAILLAAG